jgi:hypothetical protein
MPLIYEASGISLKFIGPFAAASNKRKTRIDHQFTLDLTTAELAEVERMCMLYAGTDYSFKQVINIGLANLGIRWRPFKPDSYHAQVCSEIVTRILFLLDYKINLDPDMAGPRELYEELKRVLEEKGS